MFHMAMMASHTLPKGTKDFRLLPTIYVIFFNEHDELRNGRPLSKFVWYDTDNSEKLSDKQSIVYINGSLQQESPLLASVVHDMFCKEYTEMENQVLADRMKYLRTDEGEDEMLDYVYSKLYNHIQLERADAAKEGEEKGKAAGKAEGAKAMLSDNMPHELVVKYTGLTMEQVEALSKELAAV
jgi:predicted transposase/invertase (TIGR01784 family)